MCGCAEGWIFGYGDIQMCISSGIRIDGIMGRCIIIGFVVDSVVFGRKKVFLARCAEQQFLFVSVVVSVSVFLSLLLSTSTDTNAKLSGIKIEICVVDSVVSGRRKVFLSSCAEQQLERQGGRRDGSVWSFAACLCKTLKIQVLKQVQKQIQVQIKVKMDQGGRLQLVCAKPCKYKY